MSAYYIAYPNRTTHYGGQHEHVREMRRSIAVMQVVQLYMREI